MSEQAAAPAKESFFRLPTKGHEITALGLSVLIVFAIVQFGAPVVRNLEFLDPKLRDYFIGIAFAAFPVIHRGTKSGLERFRSEPASEFKDLSPWYVTGVIAAMLLFAWNQFVSFLAALSSMVLLGAVNLEGVDAQSLEFAVMASLIMVVIPLSAVAAVLAGIVLNRQTRSHAFLAIATCTIVFAVANLFTTWVFAGDFFVRHFEAAAAQGIVGIIQFFTGVAIVCGTIFLFGSIGIFISRFYREKSIGRLMDAARQLSPSERDALATAINQQVLAAAGGTPPPAPAAS